MGKRREVSHDDLAIKLQVDEEEDVLYWRAKPVAAEQKILLERWVRIAAIAGGICILITTSIEIWRFLGEILPAEPIPPDQRVSRPSPRLFTRISGISADARTTPGSTSASTMPVLVVWRP